MSQRSEKLVRVDDLRSTPSRAPRSVPVTEPTGLAVTPKGKSCGLPIGSTRTALEVDAEAMTVTLTVDLERDPRGEWFGR